MAALGWWQARGAGSREALGCLVRGNFSAALRAPEPFEWDLEAQGGM